MAMYIVTGCYTSNAIKGLLAAPSDREAAVRPLVEAAGGRMVSFLVTTGDTDFSMVIETDDTEGLMSALMVAGATGTVSNLKTVQAFTSAQFLSAQKKAASIAANFKPAA
ncbi:GYD domain-containing protein [Boseongicola aestuarii]|uniref:GYD domain protein n=1 Tax=Boseongicola aestuarii TaxID=1470561 RepID=A0A238IY17_9RHOB|nr:GYD domain-containing protein [Boseongicola aestuarii]SMX23368.1 GYD domain protein [Boseongicola aestuarii]